MTWFGNGISAAPHLHKRSKWVVIILLSIVSTQNLFCSKKTVPFEPSDALGIANKWIYDSLKLYYYWSDQMAKPDYTLSTPAFFKRLLSPQDRFSAISNERDVVPARSVFELFGFHYSLITHPFDHQQLVGVVTMVVPGTNAAQRIKRGDFFTRVNNIAVSPATIATIQQELTSSKPAVLQLAVLNDNGTALVPAGEASVSSSGVPFHSLGGIRFFEKNGVKTGYLDYRQCIESQDGKVLDAVQKLKNAGVTELVLDLRFNPGGSVASSVKLAAMLVPSFNPDQVYVTFKGNRFGGTVKQTFRQTIAFSASSPGKSMAELQFRNLGLKRIFILTSGATISAAEMLCNNLKPYMTVVRIGTKTLGKDEASFRIEDKSNPRQVDWVLMPIVYKIFDANDKGGYGGGLLPDHEVNEFSTLPLREMGYPGDPVLDKALHQLYGTSSVDITPLRLFDSASAGTIPPRKRSFPFRNIKEQYRSVGAAGTGIEVKR